ncbi:MAG: TonB-dependent receptor [Proteobacteria bacterium]|nr:TonB-dependent receptor [Pseudomonadota bacterium]
MAFGNKRLKLLLACGVAQSALLWAGIAVADTPAAASASQIEEVVVTASKREQSIGDVPMGVSAKTGLELAQTQTLDLQDLSQQIPGINLEQGGYGGFGTRVILRGLNSGGNGATVATTVDDVPLSFTGSVSLGALFASDFEPYDMNRIEVLRGPQGTLYGASAEGGLIKYVTNAPSITDYAFGVEAGGDTVAHGGTGGDVKGYANIPINDELALRVSGYYESIPGWIRNDLRGDSQVNSGRRFGGRASVLWQPTADLTIRATAFYQDLHTNGPDMVTVNGTTNLADPTGLANGYDYDSYLPNIQSARAELYDLNIRDDWGWASLESITSYGKLDNHFGTDIPSYANLFAPGTTVTLAPVYNIKKFNQEFRLASNPGSKLFGDDLDWQVGAFYTSEAATGTTNYLVRDYPSGTMNALGSVLYSAQPSNYTELAGYADATLHFTDSLDLEVGGRVFHNHQKSQQTQGGLFLGTPIETLPATHSRETSATYSVAPSWHITSDQMVYARIASGYRPGGPEPYIPGGTPAGLPSQFNSDSTVNYEVGFKGKLFDTLSMDVAAFHIDWSKIQINSIIPVGGVGYAFTLNGGKAVSQGFEWNLAWSPVEGLTLGTSGAYTDAHISSTILAINAPAGSTLPYVPKWSGNISANYERHAFADYSAFLGATWFYEGMRRNGFAFFPVDNYQPVPSYNTFALELGLRNGRYTFELYGKNLGDSKGIAYYEPYGTGATLAYGSATLITPRTIGFRIAADF